MLAWHSGNFEAWLATLGYILGTRFLNGQEGGIPGVESRDMREAFIALVAEMVLGVRSGNNGQSTGKASLNNLDQASIRMLVLPSYEA